jgi:hypothetical protein
VSLLGLVGGNIVSFAVVDENGFLGSLFATLLIVFKGFRFERNRTCARSWDLIFKVWIDVATSESIDLSRILMKNVPFFDISGL